MKLSQSLLSAIVIGIAVQPVGSCKKEKDPTDARTQQQLLKTNSNKNTPTTYPENCPACGMG